MPCKINKAIWDSAGNKNPGKTGHKWRGAARPCIALQRVQWARPGRADCSTAAYCAHLQLFSAAAPEWCRRLGARCPPAAAASQPSSPVFFGLLCWQRFAAVLQLFECFHRNQRTAALAGGSYHVLDCLILLKITFTTGNNKVSGVWIFSDKHLDIYSSKIYIDP